jgi:DNA-binding MarR family transcriptional regulator
MSIPKKRRGRYDPASEDFRKEEFPFYWLAMVHGRYSQAMEKVLKKIGMDIPSFRVLFILKENGQSSISEISVHAIAKLSTITKIVYRMKDDGLVDTGPCSTDGRVTQVSITAKGRESIFKIQGATSELFSKSYKGLTEAQIQKLNKTLEIVFNNLPED